MIFVLITATKSCLGEKHTGGSSQWMHKGKESSGHGPGQEWRLWCVVRIPTQEDRPGDTEKTGGQTERRFQSVLLQLLKGKRVSGPLKPEAIWGTAGTPGLVQPGASRPGPRAPLQTEWEPCQVTFPLSQDLISPIHLGPGNHLGLVFKNTQPPTYACYNSYIRQKWPGWWRLPYYTWIWGFTHIVVVLDRVRLSNSGTHGFYKVGKPQMPTAINHKNLY